MDFIRIIPKYKAGKHVDENGNSVYPFVRYQKCKKVVIESEQTIGVCGDGEISPTNKVVVEVIPQAIAFSIPQSSDCTAVQEDESAKELAIIS